MQKTNSVRTRKGDKRTALGSREKCRLIQLGLCVGLFLTVLLGKGIAPEKLTQSGEDLLRLIQADTDFKGAFLSFGEAVSRGDPVWETLENLAVEVFGTGTEKPQSAQTDGPAVQMAKELLTQRPTQQVILSRLGVSIPVEETAGGGEVEQEPEANQEPEAEPENVPEIPAYTGPALPEGATMDYVALDLQDTMTPVMGRLTSQFGYRDHPVSGEYLFHAGVDLAADIGTPVQAFADGVVDFIGESEVYGLYIQLDHGNGVTSFYCHCSALYAQKGETVTKGQTIAAVGDTGNATGPHLHLELQRDGVRLNPIYYIDYIES